MNARDVSLTLTERLLGSHKTAVEEGGSAAGRNRPEVRPFTLTISREVGALGTSVAAEVGNQLGWPVYDQELIHKIADELGRPAFHVRSVDEKHFSWLEDVLSSFLDDYHINPNTYLKYLIGTIRGLGLGGKCVIVGRGSSFILPPETTLRVRLVADRKDRIAVIGRLRGISDREAADWIEKTEKERLLFVTKNFHKDPYDPHNYDLLLNVSRLRVENAARVIVETLHCFETQRGTGNAVEREALAPV